jgi:hypothetical protein
VRGIQIAFPEEQKNNWKCHTQNKCNKYINHIMGLYLTGNMYSQVSVKSGNKNKHKNISKKKPPKKYKK